MTQTEGWHIVESLVNKEIEIEVATPSVGVEIMAPPGMEEMTNQLQGMFQNLSGNKTKTRKMTVKEALKVLAEEEAAKLINEEDIKLNAVEKVDMLLVLQERGFFRVSGRHQR